VLWLRTVRTGHGLVVGIAAWGIAACGNGDMVRGDSGDGAAAKDTGTAIRDGAGLALPPDAAARDERDSGALSSCPGVSSSILILKDPVKASRQVSVAFAGCCLPGGLCGLAFPREFNALIEGGVAPRGCVIYGSSRRVRFAPVARFAELASRGL
jgi:hypothetical protein